MPFSFSVIGSKRQLLRRKRCEYSEQRGYGIKNGPRGALRPTSDRVKEALFNILGPRPGAVIWDLYAGSGAIGIEALSRGAAAALFVEKERAHREIIADNLARTKLASRAELIGQDVSLALPLLSRQGKQAHLIFADPPYQEQNIPRLLEAVEQHGLLRNSGLIVLELFARSRLWEPDHPAVELRKYGDAVLAFIEKAAIARARAALESEG